MSPAPDLSGVKPVAIPSDRAWFDPRLMMAACELATQDVQLAMGDVVLVAPPDPRRVAVGFTLPTGGAFSHALAPWPDAQAYPWAVIPTGESLWYYLHKHLNVVCAGWYFYSTSPLLVRVTTITRPR